jgi:hypothetical protein
MTPGCFLSQMAKLRTEFGAKAFTPGKEELVSKAVRSLPDASFEKIVNHFVATFRAAPLPRDFFEAAMKERAHLGHPKDTAPRKEIVCKWCVDGGVIEVLHKESGEEYFARCGCTSGENSIHTNLKRFIWAGYLANDFHVHQMMGERAMRWRPEAFNPKSAEESLRALRDIWRAKVKKSEAFWGERNDDGGAA